ncbi:MAG: type II secretion system protein [Candidatus Nealsonbacteria bacterium]|nr:type II secretion system protein [Candidatus Nealsonbacteria bacterium]
MKKGFTLIELLVVIAVIGLLSSIVFVQLGPVRAKARDAKRAQDFAEIGSAMQMCFLESTCGAGEDLFIKSASRPTAIDTDGTPSYLGSVPSDTGGTAYTWVDNSGGTGSQYCLYTTLEQDSSYNRICVSEAGVLRKNYPSGNPALGTCCK